MDVLQAFEKLHASLPDDCKDLLIAAQCRQLAHAMTTTREARALAGISRELREATRDLNEAVNGARKQGDIVDQIAAKRAARRAATKGRASAKKADGQPG
jgi:hypothetical protein